MGHFLAVAMLLSGATQGTAGRGFDRDAGAILGALAGQAEFDFLFGRVAFEKQMQGLHLSRRQDVDIYEGANATGRLTVHASFADEPFVVNKEYNSFWATFEPPTETPMSQALLGHLLGKAEKTSIGGGDEIRVTLPHETVRGCRTQYSLSMRLTTGALKNTTVEVWCHVTAK